MNNEILIIEDDSNLEETEIFYKDVNNLLEDTNDYTELAKELKESE